MGRIAATSHSTSSLRRRLRLRPVARGNSSLLAIPLLLVALAASSFTINPLSRSTGGGAGRLVASAFCSAARPHRRVAAGGPSRLTATAGSGSGSGPHHGIRSIGRGIGTQTALKMSPGGGGMMGGGESPKFKSWTFDKPCDVMDWTPFSGERIETTVVKEEGELDLDSADLIILGVVGPPKPEGDDDDAKDTDEEEEEEDIPIGELRELAKTLDEGELDGLLSAVLEENKKTFKGGTEVGAVTPAVRVARKAEDGTTRVQKYVLLGLGREAAEPSDENEGGEEKKKKDDNNKIGSKIGAAIAAQCRTEKTAEKCAVVLPSSSPLSSAAGGDGDAEGETEAAFSDLAAAFHAALYADLRFKTEKKSLELPAEKLGSLVLRVEGGGGGDTASAVERGLSSGAAIARGVYLTRDIVNAPHNVLNSVSLANVARRVASESGGRIKCTVLGKAECEKRGMGAFLGVARGSETEPQLIHLTYSPRGGDVRRKVGLVGKGLLFDTGGYNIKTAGMEQMKFDCGGSAAVLGAARAVGELALEGVEAHFIVAACENMINQKAVVPSDILTASNGKTIEVMNTDAEGRLTLADALVFADKELGCESIIELSTLTGACMISLGMKVAGVWTSDDDLAKQIDGASKATGDKSWRMPLETEYNEQLKSTFADLKNIGTRYGGAITAALFLQNFVSKKVPFAHIDIAGPVWDAKAGATGYGAKLVTEWVKRQGQKDGE